MPKFGEMLRKARRQADKTLSDLAQLLGVTVVYVSEVERGNRPPFSSDRIRQVAKYLGIDSTPLLRAALLQKGVLEIDVSNASPFQLAALSGMARGGTSESQWEQIANILNATSVDDE